MLCYENLQLDGMFAGVTISGVIIDACYNSHARMTIEGIIPHAELDQYLQQSLENEPLTLICTEEDNARILFCGVILNIKIHHASGLYTISMEAISHTYFLDIGKESKSYQDASMAYADVIDAELMGRNAVHFNCDNEQNNPINAFVLKHQETCWAFVQRLASHHHLGLLPDMTQNKPVFLVGMPEGRRIKHFDELPDQIFQQPHSVSESNTFHYALLNRLEQFDLGDPIAIDGCECRIYKVHAYLDRKDAVMRFDYYMTTQQGYSQPKLANRNIPGLCLTGMVIDRRKDFAKVHLTTVDATQKVDKATWFRLAAFYTAGEDRGWCAMPELGDTLNLYFPTENENDCFLREAICASFSPLGDRANSQSKAGLSPYSPTMGMDKTEGTLPSTKYVYVPNGQNILLNEDLIHISSKDGFSTISLTSGHTDLTGTTLGLKLKTDGDISIIGQNINIGADETESLTLTSCKSVMLICEGSSIHMDHTTGNTDFYATQVVW